MQKTPLSYQVFITSAVTAVEHGKTTIELISSRLTLLSSLMESVQTVDISPDPVFSQLFLNQETNLVGYTGSSFTKYIIVNSENKHELFHVMNILSTDPDIIGLRLISPQGEEIIKCTHNYKKDSSPYEFRNQDGKLIATLHEESRGFLFRILKPILCMILLFLPKLASLLFCCCIPSRKLSLKQPNGEIMFLIDSYLYRNMIKIYRSSSIARASSNNAGVIKMSEATISVSFSKNATVDDKLLMIGVGMTIKMDAEKKTSNGLMI